MLSPIPYDLELESFETKSAESDTFLKKVETETLIDRFRRLEVKIKKFEKISNVKYAQFMQILKAFEDKYKYDLEEYKMAVSTNKLTLAVNPETNTSFFRQTRDFEEAIQNYETEYAYLVLKKRLEEFVDKVEVLYLQVVSKKKDEKLKKLIDKANAKLEEILMGSDMDSLSKNETLYKEEMVSLYFKAKYYVSKCYVRFYFPDVSLNEYFNYSDKTEYLKYLIADVEILSGKLMHMPNSHPMKERLENKISYLKVFGYKEPIEIFEMPAYFDALFFAEEYLLEDVPEFLCEALDQALNLENITEDCKFLLQLILIFYGKKLTHEDVYELILFFDKDAFSKPKKYKDEEGIFGRPLYKYLKTDRKSKLVSSKKLDKYYFVLSVLDEDLEKVKRALKKLKVDFKIKEKKGKNEVYIIRKDIINLSFV